MNRRQRRRFKAAGAIKVTFFAGLDDQGETVGWFWVRDEVADDEPRGPFTSRAAAEEDLRVVLFGRDTKIIEGGSLKRDPAHEGLH